MRRAVAILAVFLAACGRCGGERPAPDASPPASTPISPSPSPSPSPSTPDAEAPPPLHCLAGMSPADTFCIDTYEAYVVLLDATGREHPHSPFHVVDTANVRAKVAAGVTPQAYISQISAKRACANAGKRLCKKDEFERACRGPDDVTLYPYGGAERIQGACNEGKGSSIPRFFGTEVSSWTYEDFNDPRLNQWIGGLAKTGAHPRCVSPYGVYDLVGNLHEWGDDEADAKGHGRFRGGFYGDAEVNGHGCLYVTKAHEPTYHDYSTGFRCCTDPRTL